MDETDAYNQAVSDFEAEDAAEEAADDAADGSDNDNAATTPTTGDNGLLSNSFWSSLLGAAGNVGSAALTGTNPATTPVTSTASIASFLPLLLIGGVILVIGMLFFRKSNA